MASEFSQPHSGVPRHFHENAVLSLVVEGAAHERIGNIEHELRPASLLYKPAGEVHTHEYGVHGTRIVAVEIPSVLALEWMGNDAGQVHTLRVPGHPALTRLRTELRSHDDLSAYAMQSAVLELLTTVLRAQRQSEIDTVVASRTRDYLHDTSAAEFKLENLALEMDVSARRLDTCFRRVYGCSLAQYGRDVRFNRAVDLLSRANTTIAAVAAEVGYCDQAHMSRDFVQRTGMPPSWSRAYSRRKIQKCQILQYGAFV